MKIYTNLPDDIKDKVDVHIIKNVKDYSKGYLHPEIKEFRRRRIINKIYQQYRDYKERYELFFTYGLIENDILFWLNQPSDNEDIPLVLDRTSNKFKRFLRRAFPYAPPNINEQGYNTLTKHISKYQLVNMYFKKLNVMELESFYRYRNRKLNLNQSKYVNKIPII